MSNIMEKLLDGVEVEWKALGEMTNFANGKGHEKDILEDGKYIVVNSKFISSDGKVAKYSNNQLCPLFVDDVLIVMSDLPNGKALAKTFIVDKNEKYTLNQRIGAISVKNKMTLLPKFLNYFLNRTQQLTKYDNGADQTNLRKDQILSIQIPIPPLAIQTKIVRILDAFTAHTAELTARKKQYSYYRDQLLTFEEGQVEWKPLGELAENLDSMRKPITSGLRDSGEIPYYGASGIVDYVKDYIFDGDFLLVSEDGANLTARSTPIAFSISGKNWVNNHAHVLKFNTYAERRFVEFYLNSIDLTPYISGAAQPKLNQKNLNSIRIPNPSPAEQARIVTILDKFDALTNSITEGLPREIELRQQQYAYYRDLLLSFKVVEMVSDNQCI